MTEYIGLEPLTEFHAGLQETIASFQEQFPSRIIGSFIEDIPSSENGTYDSVILGNVLCEVPNEVQVLAHVKRLLKKNGRVYFSEHVYDKTQRWRALIQV